MVTTEIITNTTLPLFLETYDTELLDSIFQSHKENLHNLPIDTLTVLLQHDYDVAMALSRVAKDNYDNVNDEALAFLAKEGDEEAKNTIAIRYVKYVEKVVTQLVRKGRYNKGYEPEDLIQSGYIGFFEAIKDFKIEMKKPFKVFTKNVVSRHITSLIKRSQTNKLSALNTAYSFNTPISSDSDSTFEETIRTTDFFPEDMMLDKETFYEFWELLSKAERRVLLYKSKFYTYEEIGWKVFPDKTPKQQAKSVDNAIQRIRIKRYDYLLRNDMITPSAIPSKVN